MEEYEYSFAVKSIKPYIDYCEKNNYKLISKNEQIRIVFENTKMANIIARITTTIEGSKTSTFFDVKNVEKKIEKLKISAESLPIKITQRNEKSIYSMLEVLNFKEVVKNHRIRYNYSRNGVLFEIDNYLNNKDVVAIEGNKLEVDKVYKQICHFEKQNITD